MDKQLAAEHIAALLHNYVTHFIWLREQMHHGWFCWNEWHNYYRGGKHGGWIEWLCSHNPHDVDRFNPAESGW